MVRIEEYELIELSESQELIFQKTYVKLEKYIFSDHHSPIIDKISNMRYNKISDFYMILKGDDFRIPTAYARGPKRKN